MSLITNMVFSPGTNQCGIAKSCLGIDDSQCFVSDSARYKTDGRMTLLWMWETESTTRAGPHEDWNWLMGHEVLIYLAAELSWQFSKQWPKAGWE